MREREREREGGGGREREREESFRSAGWLLYELIRCIHHSDTTACTVAQTPPQMHSSLLDLPGIDNIDNAYGVVTNCL